MNLVRFSILAATTALVGGAACAAIAGIELPTSDRVDLGDGLSVLQSEIVITSSCTSPAEEDITLENVSDVERAYVISAPADAPLALGEGPAENRELRGTVAPKQRINVKVRVSAKKVGKYPPGNLTVRIGDKVATQLPYTVDVKGIELAVFPTRIDFGEIRQQTPAAPQTVEVRNLGTDPVTIERFEAAAAGAEFTISTLPQTIQPGSAVSVSAALIAGAVSPPLSATFEAKTNVVLCNETPPVVTLTGVRVNKEVTVGPTSVEFGELDCNAKNIAEKAITITSYANEPVAFKVAPLAPGSRLSVTPTEGTLPAVVGDAGTASVTQQLNVKLADMNDTTADALGPHVENVTIGMTGPETKDVVVPVKVTSVGAVLALTPSAVEYTSNSTKSITVTNTGNKFVYVRGAFSGAQASAFSAVSNIPVYNASSTALEVRFNTQAVGITQTAEVTVVRTNTPFLPFYPPNMQVCNAPVPATALSGFRTPQ